MKCKSYKNGFYWVYNKFLKVNTVCEIVDGGIRVVHEPFLYDLRNEKKLFFQKYTILNEIVDLHNIISKINKLKVMDDEHLLVTVKNNISTTEYAHFMDVIEQAAKTVNLKNPIIIKSNNFDLKTVKCKDVKKLKK